MNNSKQIIWLTGASGVGKTTLLNSLKEKYSNNYSWEFLKFDSIGVPSNKEIVKENGSAENWQRAKPYILGNMSNLVDLQVKIVY